MLRKPQGTVLQATVGGLILYILGGLSFSNNSFGQQLLSLRTGKWLASIRDVTAEYGNRRQPPCNLTSAFNSSLLSPATGTIDGRFYCAALQTGTDKIIAHHYQYMYSLHLQHLEHQQLRLLEIGLGCDMYYGPGRSVKLWKSMAQTAVVSFLEYNASCALDFRSTVIAGGGRMYIGSQANTTLLQQVVQEAEAWGELYDVIIDDGGHKPDHQLITLQHLWPALKSGGIYVVEDIMTHFIPFYGVQNGTSTLIPWIKEMMELMHCNTHSRFTSQGLAPDFKQRCLNLSSMEREVMSIDCMVDACVLVKAVPPSRSEMERVGDWVEKFEQWPKELSAQHRGGVAA